MYFCLAELTFFALCVLSVKFPDYSGTPGLGLIFPECFQNRKIGTLIEMK